MVLVSYLLCVLGKNGEPMARTVVSLEFCHRLLRKKFYQKCQSDDQGRIFVPKMDDNITQMVATLAGRRVCFNNEFGGTVLDVFLRTCHVILYRFAYDRRHYFFVRFPSHSCKTEQQHLQQ